MRLREFEEFKVKVECRFPKPLVDDGLMFMERRVLSILRISQLLSPPTKTYDDRSVSLELLLFVDISLFIVFHVFELAATALSSAFMLILLSRSQTMGWKERLLGSTTL